MFGDLKRTVEAMIESSTRPQDIGRSVVIDKKVFNNFIREYKVCFVEPEDDAEFQEWQNHESTSS